MPDVADFTQPDWEWLRRVLGAERADDAEYPDRVEAAIALRDAGMPEDAVRGWTDVVDAHPNRHTVFMDGVVDRILDLHQHGITTANGAPWLHHSAPAKYVPLLINANRTPHDYNAFLNTAWDNRNRLPRLSARTPQWDFVADWLFGSTFPLNEALAYALAGIRPAEALAHWEPLRQTEPQRWATTLQFMAAMLTNPDTERQQPTA